MNFKYRKETTAKKKINNGGYYILLGICMMLTGVMWRIAAEHIPERPQERTVQISSSKVLEEYVPPVIEKPEPPEAAPQISKDDFSVSADDYAVPVSVTPQEESVVLNFIPPVMGDILTDYARETFVYNNTMEDWRCHEAIDYRGDIGSQVKASEGGIVESITSDEMYGTVITIRHADGVATRYSGVQEKTIVSEGQTVKKGEIIGGIGVSGAFEIVDPPHLHFEVIVNGKNINPHDVLD